MGIVELNKALSDPLSGRVKIGRGQNLPGRAEFHIFALKFFAELGEMIKGADRFNLITEKIEAHGLFMQG